MLSRVVSCCLVLSRVVSCCLVLSRVVYRYQLLTVSPLLPIMNCNCFIILYYFYRCYLCLCVPIYIFQCERFECRSNAAVDHYIEI